MADLNAGMSIEETKRAMRRVLELTEALQEAQTDADREKLIKELMELAKAGLGVEGTA